MKKHELSKRGASRSVIGLCRGRLFRGRAALFVLSTVLFCMASSAVAIELPWEREPTPEPAPARPVEPAPAAGGGAALFDRGIQTWDDALDEKTMQEAMPLFRQAADGGYLAELPRRAEAGDAAAQYHLYWAAKHVLEDTAEIAAEMAELPVALAAGEISEEEAASLREAFRVAKALADLFRESGLAVDSETYVRWLRRAAEQGHATAQHSLGGRYAYGGGVAQDHAEAVRWYRRAAEQGLAPAQISLAYAYRTGSGVPEDKAEAMRWLRRAAEQDDPWGYYYLGDLSFEQKDYAGGMRAFNRAAELWRDDRRRLMDLHETAAMHLDDTELIEPADLSACQAQMLIWLRRMVELGDVSALSSIGSAYWSGHGVAQDHAEAVRWYRRAAEQGCPIGQYGLGLAYEWGQGVPQDRAKALIWYRKAHAQGFEGAEERIEALTADE